MSNKRSLFVFYAFAFFMLINYNCAQGVIPLYVLDSGGTEFFAGLQNSLFFLIAVGLRFYFGPLADRKGNWVVLFIAGLSFLIAPLLFLLNQSLPYIIFVRMIQAIGLAAYFPSASALACALSPREKQGTFMGFYRMIVTSTLLIGPPLAFQVIEALSYTWYHILSMIVGLMAVVILYFVQEPQKVKNSGGEKAAPGNMLKLLKEKSLRPIYLCILFVALFFGVLLTYTVIFVTQHVPEVNPGIFFTLFGAGGIIANLITGPISDRIGRKPVVVPCLIIMGAGMVAFYFLPVNHAMMYVGSILTGFGQAGCMTALITWIVDKVPPAGRTTALALQDNVEDIGIALGAFLFAAMIPMTGMAWLYGMSGVLIILFAILKVIDPYTTFGKGKGYEKSGN